MHKCIYVYVISVHIHISVCVCIYIHICMFIYILICIDSIVRVQLLAEVLHDLLYIYTYIYILYDHSYSVPRVVVDDVMRMSIITSTASPQNEAQTSSA